MRKLSLIFISAITLASCSGTEPDLPVETNPEQHKWIVPEEDIKGSLNPFPLALDPEMFKAKNIDFISGDSRTAVIRFNHETRVYPYEFVSKYEAVNDRIGDKEFTVSFCPITKSGIVLNRDFENINLILRASGYLYRENQVLFDENTESYWSQMLLKSIKGSYSGKKVFVLRHIELPWKIVKTYFPEALVFTHISISDKSAIVKKEVPEKDEMMFGILNEPENPTNGTSVFLYSLHDFSGRTELKKKIVLSDEILIVGNNDLGFITSYINDTGGVFTAVQDQFPVVLKDDQNNLWNIFGEAVSGPDKGKLLESPVNFFALLWAWESFYSDILIE